MDEIRQDLLSLNYSPSFQISGMQEADVNLSLPPATLSASISGSVTVGALPLADATVKLFGSSGAPFMHAVTDASGSFSFDVVPAGTYSLAAVREGYLLSPSVAVTLSAGGSASVSLACTPETALSLGAVAGTVNSVGLDGNGPVAGAKLSLSNLSGAVLVATTRTNTEGKYLFGGVVAGEYVVKAKL